MNDLKQLRRDVAGFSGRFFFDAERGDIGYVAKACDERTCACERRLNSDGDQDCSISVVDELDDHVAEPIVRMLNAVGPLLDEIERLNENAARMREYRFALEGVPTDGNGNPLGLGKGEP